MLAEDMFAACAHAASEHEPWAAAHRRAAGAHVADEAYAAGWRALATLTTPVAARVRARHGRARARVRAARSRLSRRAPHVDARTQLAPSRSTNTFASRAMIRSPLKKKQSRTKQI